MIQVLLDDKKWRFVREMMMKINDDKEGMVCIETYLHGNYNELLSFTAQHELCPDLAIYSVMGDCIWHAKLHH